MLRLCSIIDRWMKGEYGVYMGLFGRGKLKYSEQNVSYFHFIYHRFMWTVLGWKSGLYGGQRSPDEIKHEYTTIFFLRLQMCRHSTAISVLKVRRYINECHFWVVRTTAWHSTGNGFRSCLRGCPNWNFSWFRSVPSRKLRDNGYLK